MKTLLECLKSWLYSQHDDSNARWLVLALAELTLKRIDSADAAQRGFDAETLAAECKWEEADHYEAAKRKVDRNDLVHYLKARRVPWESYCREQHLTQALRAVKRSPSGRHRASWALEVYELAADETEPTPISTPAVPVDASAPEQAPGIEYDCITAKDIQLSWIGRLLLGSGKFDTKSLRSMGWLLIFLSSALILLLLMLGLWGMMYLDRPLQTRDLASVFVSAVLSWSLWIMALRPFAWLLVDRITLASDMLTSLKEDPTQLELAKDGERRSLGLVRYQAVCGVCAAKVRLGYGCGNQRRRLFGRCDESPQEHVFTFDRVTRVGVRLPVRR